MTRTNLLIYLGTGYGVIALITIVAMWVLFKKMNKPGWLALIPFVRTFVMVDATCASTKPFWGWLITIILSSIVSTATQSAENVSLVLALIQIIVSIAAVFCEFRVNQGLAFSFNKSSIFALGLTLFGFIFLPILAFGNNFYYGNSDVNLDLPFFE